MIQEIKPASNPGRGTSWTDVGGPDPNTSDDYLASIASVPGTTDLWAVGNTDNGALILHY